jgi:hypothetical protein
MPFSDPAGKMWSLVVLLNLERARPIVRVLDVGPGRGVYSQFRKSWQHSPQHWTAVEVWGPYVKEYDLVSKYDEVIVADIRYLDWSLVAPQDLVICGDVLEHMTKAEALSVVTRALEHARVVLISIPIIHMPQDEVYGNQYEAHVKDDWTHQECLASFPDIVLALEQPPVGVYLLTRNAEDRLAIKQMVAGGLKAGRPLTGLG